MTDISESNRKRNQDTEVDGAAKKQDSRASKGIAHLKAEFVVLTKSDGDGSKVANAQSIIDYNDDEEGSTESRLAGSSNGQDTRKSKKQGKKNRGQNKNRDNRQAREEHALCGKFVRNKDATCPFGTQCRYVHDVKAYLSHKAPEIKTGQFSVCPVWESLGYCPMGFKCSFLSSHCDMETLELRELPEGSEERTRLYDVNHEINHIDGERKYDLIKKRFAFTKSDHILEIIDSIQQENRDLINVKENSKSSSNGEPMATVETPQAVERESKLAFREKSQAERTVPEVPRYSFFCTGEEEAGFTPQENCVAFDNSGELALSSFDEKAGC